MATRSVQKGKSDMKRSLALAACIAAFAAVFAGCASRNDVDSNPSGNDSSMVRNDDSSYSSAERTDHSSNTVVDRAESTVDDVIDGGKRIVDDTASTAKDVVDNVTG